MNALEKSFYMSTYIYTLNMKSTKIVLLLAFTVMLILPVVYAGWFSDWATGWQTGVRQTNLTITVSNTDPVVTYVSNPGSQSVTEGASAQVDIEVHVYDADGVATIDDAQTYLNITILNGDSAVRTHSPCSNEADIDGNEANYTCTVYVWYWDTPGWWNITAHGEDVNNAADSNESQTFQLQDTTAINLAPDQITFTSGTPGTLDVQGSNDPTRINNTANHNISANDLTVTALDLYGNPDGNYKIPAENFSVNINDACEGDLMSNGSAISVSSYELPRGNLSAGVAYEEIYYCIEQIPEGISEQDYDTSDAGPWVITAS